jgi:DNA-binding MarR family transcriptional regulator
VTPATTAPGSGEAIVDALLSMSRVLMGLTARTLDERNVDVTLTQYRALVVLASRGPQRTMDLAVELGVQSSTATRMCDRLIRKDLVRRFQRADDRRVSWLGLTETGKELIGDTMRRRRDAITQLVTKINSPIPDGVASVLTALVTAAGETPDPQWWDHWARSVVHDHDGQPSTMPSTVT